MCPGSTFLSQSSPGVFTKVVSLQREGKLIDTLQKSEIPNFQSLVGDIREILSLLEEHPYCIPLYVLLGLRYLLAGYPDLASGAAYKALLLADAVQDVADEYHDLACEALRQVIYQQPIVERISLLKGELHADVNARQGRFGEPDEETDVEVDLWLREHYLLLTYVHKYTAEPDDAG